MNTKQKQAVSCADGINIVYSGAGTGKTTIISQRFAYLVNEKKIDPKNILAITFTKKAAVEMRTRIWTLIDKKFHTDTNIYTFHSFANNFLRQTLKKRFLIFDDLGGFIKNFNADKNFKLIIERYKSTVLKLDTTDLMQDGLLDELCEIYFDSKSDNLELYKTNLINCFTAYQNYLQTTNQIDFNDMLIQTCALLKANPKLLKNWANNFLHILVDEFQDTNQIQYEMLKLLASEHKNLFLVGDNNQMIYGWRGAISDIFSSLKREFKVANEFYVTQNYRSDQSILNISNDVLDAIAKKENKTLNSAQHLFSEINSGIKPVYFQASSLQNQAVWILHKIKELHQTNNIPFREMAVLFRTNKEIETVVEVLEEDGSVPLKQQNSALKKLDQLILVLRALWTNSDYDIKRGLRALGFWSVKLNQALKEIQIDLCLFLKNFESFKFSFDFTVQDKLQKAASLFCELLEIYQNQPLSTLLEYLIDKLKIEPFIKNVIWKTLNSFENKIPSLELFLNELILNQQLLQESQADTLNLLTVHSAKGLEFDVVFVYGLIEGNFPLTNINSNIVVKTQTTLMEELKLFYVALTRAKRFLFLVSVSQISKNSIRPSSFIDLIDKQNLEIATINFKNDVNDDFFDSERKIDYQANYHNEKQNFIVGDIVNSKIFGAGVIIEVTSDAVLVAFKNSKYGVKWILKHHRSLTKALY